MNEKISSEPVTSRIEKSLLDVLRKEAVKNDQSLNSLITQIFKQHVEWHNNAAKAGFISVRRKLVSRLISDLSDEKIIEIADDIAKNDARSFIFLLRNQYNIISAIEVLETWLKIAGYPYNHEVKFETHAFSIHHEMGRKWSLFLLEQYGKIFNSFGVSLYHIEMDENMISFKFDLS